MNAREPTIEELLTDVQVLDNWYDFDDDPTKRLQYAEKSQQLTDRVQREYGMQTTATLISYLEDSDYLSAFRVLEEGEQQ